MEKPKLLRIREVMERTGMSRTSLYRMIDHGDFKKPIQITKRCVGWLETEVDEWIQVRIDARRK